MKIPDNIMDIYELIENIENGGYIDCNKNLGYADDNEYESIMFYLNLCKGWSFVQKINNLHNRNFEEILDDKSS